MCELQLLEGVQESGWEPSLGVQLLEQGQWVVGQVAA